MEDNRDQELKHVCKLCNKRYPSGKSLGGHMRSHVIAHSHAAVQKVKASSPAQKASSFENGERDSSKVENGGSGGGSSGGVGGHSAYGLRENPRKTWRVVDSSFAVKQDRVCKQCGKGFQSLKALCGHMSSHSGKERNYIRDDDDGDGDGLWSSGEEEEEEEEEEDDKEFAMESHSDNVVDAEMIINSRPKRSREVRYKSLAVDSVSLANGSSSNSEIEQEQEDVAICLMMLSRDSFRQKDGVSGSGCGEGGVGLLVGGSVYFASESSDNNSIILEGGSSSNHMGIAKRDTLNSGSNGPVKTKQARNYKLKRVEMDNSDSGYFENGAKELESDGSVDRFIKNYGFKKPKIDYGSRLEAYDRRFSKGAKNRKFYGNYSLEKASIEAEEDYEVDRARTRHDSRSRLKNGFNSSEVADDFISKKIKQDLLSLKTQKNGLKGSKYECSICNKGFKTHQALGGHIITHRKSKGSIGSKYDQGENSIETSSCPKSRGKNATFEKKTGTKKTKGHKCPFCTKVFRSGQALGGHKRSHLIGSSSSQQGRAIPAPAVEGKQSQSSHGLIDLNLPAPVEEEASGHAQYMPW